MNGRYVWTFIAGALVFPLWPYVMAILRALALALAAFFGGISGMFTPSTPTSVAVQQVAPAPAAATDPALLTAIVKMGEGQQQIAGAVSKNTEVLGQLVTVIAQQQARPAAPAAPAPCTGDCWNRGEYIPIPQQR